MNVERDYAGYVSNWSRTLIIEQKAISDKKNAMLKFAKACSVVLCEKYHANTVYLIGSLLEDNFINSHSDVDIAVEGLKDRVYLRALNELYSQLPDNLQGVHIDLITLESALPTMYEYIKSFGVVLYEKS